MSINIAAYIIERCTLKKKQIIKHNGYCASVLKLFNSMIYHSRRFNKTEITKYKSERRKLSEYIPPKLYIQGRKFKL